MKKAKIIFRCDGGNIPQIGTGHVQRCLLVAQGLCNLPDYEAADLLFAIRRNGPFLPGYRMVREAGFEVLQISDNQLIPNSKCEATTLSCAVAKTIIFDRLNTQAKYIRFIQDSKKFVISFDDLGTGASLSDIVINAIVKLPGKSRNVYKGYNYLVLQTDRLRSSVVKAESSVVLSKKDTVPTVFVSFGGYDHRDFMYRFLRLIDEHALGSFAGVRFILIGKAKSGIRPLFDKQLARLNQFMVPKILHLERTEDLVWYLQSADVAVVNGGLTAFNSISLGIPTVGVPQYAHQLETLQSLSAAGLLKVVSKGMSFSDKQFGDCIVDLIKDLTERHALSQRCLSTFRGEGTSRVVSLIAGLGIEQKNAPM